MWVLVSLGLPFSSYPPFGIGLRDMRAIERSYAGSRQTREHPRTRQDEWRPYEVSPCPLVRRRLFSVVSMCFHPVRCKAIYDLFCSSSQIRSVTFRAIVKADRIRWVYEGREWLSGEPKIVRFG